MSVQYVAALAPVFAGLVGWPGVDEIPAWQVRTGSGLSIKVAPDGTVHVIVPADADVDEVVSFVTGQRRWIARTLQRRPKRHIKELVDGERFTWLGEPLTLRLTDDAGPVVRRDGGDLLLHRGHANAATVIGWYCAQGQAWIDEHAPAWAQRMGVPPGLRTEVRDLGSRRWGVYYTPPRHEAHFHWPLFQLPEHLVDCVTVHELAHAVAPVGKPHGPQWRAVMTRTLPDWRRRKHEKERTPVWWGDVAAPQRRPTLAELVFGTNQPNL